MNKKNISKRFIAVFLVFMMSFFMISCGNKEKKKLTAQNEDNKTKETTEEIKEQNKDITEELTTEDTTPKVDYEAIYEPVLKENYDALVNGYDYEKDYKYLSSGVMEALTYENDNNMLLDEMGYIIEDISGDGIPELMIGRNNPTSADNMADEEGYIYSGYTYKDGELVCFLEGWARSRHQMIGDNDFYYSGSSGAMNSVFGQYHLSDDATEIIWDDFYFTEPNDDFTDVDYYHNKTGTEDIASSEKMDVAEDEFWNFLNDKKPVAIDWISMRTYGGADDTSEVSTEDNGTKTTVDLSDMAATWLYPNGASLVIEENGNWSLYDDSENWLFSGEWNADVQSDYIAITLKSEVGDSGNSQVGTGKFYYDNSGYAALDMQFEPYLTDFSNGVVTLYKGL